PRRAPAWLPDPERSSMRPAAGLFPLSSWSGTLTAGSSRRKGGMAFAGADTGRPSGDSTYALLVTRGRSALATGLAALWFVVSFVGCGGGSTTRTGGVSSAIAPSGASAYAVSYHCRSGRRGTITVTLPKPSSLAQVFNPIDV